VTERLKAWASYFAELGYGDSIAGSTGERVRGVEASSAGPVSTRDGTDDPAHRRLRLEALAAEAADCRLCGLSQGRKTVVFGDGDSDADLMFIGEGPGAEEDRQGLPFVGRAGQLLNKIIEAIDLRREDVYIANIVKCRPPGNRDPHPDEVAACRPYLEQQIQLVAPRVIVALGRVAAQALLGESTPIGKLRGHWHSAYDVAVMPTYHPAALLRNSALKRPVWDDMQRVRDRMNEASQG
jgi:uracil-DNA glycosylase family 4